MDGKTYLKLIEQRLQRYFDNKTLDEALPFALIAELNASDEGYFMVPSIKTYSVKHNEYLFVQRFTKTVTKEQIEPYINLIKEKMQTLKTTTEHMSSLFALVFICEDGMAPNLENYLVKIKYHKDYCFSLKGWSDLALYVVDIPSQKLIYNKAGQKTAGYFAFKNQ